MNPISPGKQPLAQHQPNVHIVADALCAYATRGILPKVDLSDLIGSDNMNHLAYAQNYIADPNGQAAPLLAFLDNELAAGLFTNGTACEQGIADPHFPLDCTALGALLKEAVSKNNEALLSRLVQIFQGIYAMGLALSTTQGGLVIGPGVRMVVSGPHSPVLDATVGIIGGRVRKFPFQHIFRDTVGPWALLQALMVKPHLFDEARTWTIDTCAAHWPVLRWPLTVERCVNGHRAMIEVGPQDAGNMANIGNTGVGCCEVRASTDGSIIQWMAWDTKVWYHKPDGKLTAPMTGAPLDLGPVVKTITKG